MNVWSVVKVGVAMVVKFVVVALVCFMYPVKASSLRANTTVL